MHQRSLALAACATLVVSLCPLLARTSSATSITTVFSTDFESGLPAQFTAPGSVLDGVQGYAGLGPAGYQFGGSFLHYTQQTLYDTKLDLSGLPSHDHINLRFLLALIDSWDGTELMQVLVDGNLVFSNSWQLATGDTTSYVPAPGTLLSAGTNLGFTGGQYYNHDRAYNMAYEPAFLDIPHSASSLHVIWRIGAVSGGAADQWQGGTDESWAIDRVEVDVITGSTDVAPDGMEFGLGRPTNPQRGTTLRVEYALAGDAPATLELLDIGGRRVDARTVAGAGRATAVLGGTAPLGAGVYFVRLTQAGRIDTQRLVVVR
jgi:hypothetical protein